MDHADFRQNAQSHPGEKYGAIYEKRIKVILQQQRHERPKYLRGRGVTFVTAYL
jgi:hypothetical protein